MPPKNTGPSWKNAMPAVPVSRWTRQRKGFAWNNRWFTTWWGRDYWQPFKTIYPADVSRK